MTDEPCKLDIKAASRCEPIKFRSMICECGKTMAELRYSPNDKVKAKRDTTMRVYWCIQCRRTTFMEVQE